MKVRGNLIPESALDAAVLLMKRSGVFHSSDIQQEMRRHLPDFGRRLSTSIVMQVADRLIQRERKAGNILPLEQVIALSLSWYWVGAQ